MDIRLLTHEEEDWLLEEGGQEALFEEPKEKIANYLKLFYAMNRRTLGEYQERYRNIVNNIRVR